MTTMTDLETQTEKLRVEVGRTKRWDSTAEACFVRFLWTNRYIENATRTFASEKRVTPASLNVLFALWDHRSGRTQSELASVLVITTSTLSVLLRSLADRKPPWVTKSKEAAHGRSARWRVTKEGKKVLLNVLPEFHWAVRQLFSEFSLAEQAQFLDFMERLAAKAEDFRFRLRSKFQRSIRD